MPKGKPTGKDLLKLAATKIGQEYVFGAEVPFGAGDYNGPWDCAEFVSWVIWKLTGEKYGFTENGYGEPWTGAWLDDMLQGKVYRVPRHVAVKTAGAVLLRRNKKGGHIAFSCGNGSTIEAKGTKYGVCSDTADPDVRGWQYGILIPGVQYK